MSDWRILARRWYVLLVGLPATVVLCWLAAGAVPLQYELQSNVLMLPPTSIVNGKQTNPYLQLGGLEGVADVLSTSMLDASVSDDLKADGSDIEYEVSRDFTKASPVLLLDIKADSPESAAKAQTFLLSQLPKSLYELQAKVGVSPVSRVTSTVITEDKQAKVSRKNQIRILLVSGLAGLTLTYLSAAVLDSVLMNRRKKKAAPARPLAPIPVPPDPRSRRPAPAESRGRPW